MLEKWKTRYGNRWCTEYQLQRLVDLGVLTHMEYNLIVIK